MACAIVRNGSSFEVPGLLSSPDVLTKKSLMVIRLLRSISYSWGASITASATGAPSAGLVHRYELLGDYKVNPGQLNRVPQEPPRTAAAASRRPARGWRCRCRRSAP